MSDSASLPPPDYEPSDGTPRLIVLTAAGLTFGIGLVLAASAAVCRSFGDDRPKAAVRGSVFLFEHGPLERTGIEREWEEQDRLVGERLESYGWVDRKNGVVRIPIERAMAQLAKEHAEKDSAKRP